ncbi:MAG TPA: class I mannose-6-phosphate isomerase [Thermotogota bacterium]|nr:class I mannose-6-phosphate isomerase [Thermotogota bacterium]OQC30172.1 MAG: putative mannose-6-phosphate isomerase GmuF [Thermotogota bacterium ADurb.Bin062]HNW47435.1 class I mannose-6-phosphate isomerase [Thermotogota bacterium]HOD92057.1 class I mannose-6-phosphate isomerase [Thermotogota bacterium]HOF24398.1 class I mannose-6-phosphate isomerase [Thermotogota bacterium]
MIYRAEPIFVERPWGGPFFRQLFPNCPEGPIGEVWLLSGLEGKSTPLVSFDSNEPEERALSDRTREMIGSELPRFPVLVKLLKAEKWLSVQVHPNDRFARLEEGEPWGKSELWAIVGTDEEALLIDGFKEGLSLESLRYPKNHETFARKIETAIHFVKPEIGEIYEIPSGTVHALGPGVMVIEIQQASELTYRLLDWGRQRPLQVEKAIAATLSEGLRAKRHLWIQGVSNDYFDCTFRSDGTAEGFCLMLSQEHLIVDHVRCPPWQVIIVPSGEMVRLEGAYMHLSLGPIWRSYIQ